MLFFAFCLDANTLEILRRTTLKFCFEGLPQALPSTCASGWRKKGTERSCAQTPRIRWVLRGEDKHWDPIRAEQTSSPSGWAGPYSPLPTLHSAWPLPQGWEALQSKGWCSLSQQLDKLECLVLPWFTRAVHWGDLNLFISGTRLGTDSCGCMEAGHGWTLTITINPDPPRCQHPPPYLLGNVFLLSSRPTFSIK